MVLSHPLTEGLMIEPKERITVNVPSSLKHTVEHEAKAAGQTLSVWVERALTAHLSTIGQGIEHVQGH
jgi:hypothetical protein